MTNWLFLKLTGRSNRCMRNEQNQAAPAESSGGIKDRVAMPREGGAALLPTEELDSWP